MSADRTARLELPYLAAGQMQKHVTLNEALTRLDALVQTLIASRTTTAQPGAPEEGALYVLPTGRTGTDWAARAVGTVVRADMGGWVEVPVQDGLIALVQDAGELIVRSGGDWVALGSRLGALQGLSRVGLNTTADAANPFAARVNKALWTALESGAGGDGDLRLTFNKETAGDVLSLLFQSGFSGRAELGLIGGDDLTLKVSQDGTVWQDALSVDRATGRARFAKGATRREATVFTTGGSYVVPAWTRSIEAIVVGGGGGGGAGAAGASGTRHGGGGGGAGGYNTAIWSAEALGGDLTVVVGAGGSTGNAGGVSSVARGAETLIRALGGAGGVPGASGGAGGAGGLGQQPSNAGGSSSVISTSGAGGSLSCPHGAGGGGGGGGLSGAGVAQPGGDGGDGAPLLIKTIGGIGGMAVGTGGNGGAVTNSARQWSGGGGGGGAASSTGAGWPGGTGGLAGAGGGGGGASTTSGGAGGAGGAGLVCLIAQG